MTYDPARARMDRPMPFWVDGFIRETQHLSTDEFGAYMLILSAMWMQRTCDFPDDDRKLATVSRVSPRLWKSRIGPTLRPLFIVRDGKLISEKLRKEARFVERQVTKQHAKKKPENLDNLLKDIDQRLSVDDPRTDPGIHPSYQPTNLPLEEEIPPPPIEHPAREAPPEDGGGGDFQSDFGDIDALLGEVREASGVRVVDVAAGRAAVGRWLGLGLSREEILDQVRARTAKLIGKDPPDPPFALAAFDVSMDQLAAAKARASKPPERASPKEAFERKVASAVSFLRTHGTLPDWLRDAAVAAELMERGLATEDQLRRIMPLDLLPRRKA